MHFDYKQHETTVLDDMPADFDETVVLGDEWHKRHTKGGTSWSTGILFNIKDEHLHDATDRARLLAACHGQGAADGLPFTWECAARKLWSRAGLGEDGFEQAWAEAEEAPHHDGSTLRHYSRESERGRAPPDLQAGARTVRAHPLQGDGAARLLLEGSGRRRALPPPAHVVRSCGTRGGGSRTTAPSWRTSS